MIIINDWLEAIEDELTSGGGPLTEREAELVTAAIKKLTPFKPDETYMLVPRCETCAHWRVLAGYPTFCSQLSTPENVPLVEPTQSTGEFICAADFGCVAWEAK